MSQHIYLYFFRGMQFDVGVPAVTSSSGFTLLIVPGVMGVAIFSPPLNDYDVSMRG